MLETKHLGRLKDSKVSLFTIYDMLKTILFSKYIQNILSSKLWSIDPTIGTMQIGATPEQDWKCSWTKSYQNAF